MLTSFALETCRTSPLSGKRGKGPPYKRLRNTLFQIFSIKKCEPPTFLFCPVNHTDHQTRCSPCPLFSTGPPSSHRLASSSSPPSMATTRATPLLKVLPWLVVTYLKKWKYLGAKYHMYNLLSKKNIRAFCSYTYIYIYTAKRKGDVNSEHLALFLIYSRYNY